MARPIPAFSSPSSYLSLTRNWKSGDVVELTLPMRLHRSHMPDDRSVQAVMYGPLVLAGRLGSEGLTEAMQIGDYDQDYKGTVAQVGPISAPLEGDPGWVEPVKGRPLTFTTVNQARAIELVPVSAIHGEKYGLLAAHVIGILVSQLTLESWASGGLEFTSRAPRFPSPRAAP